jgi:hypothetical protein
MAHDVKGTARKLLITNFRAHFLPQRGKKPGFPLVSFLPRGKKGYRFNPLRAHGLLSGCIGE